MSEKLKIIVPKVGELVAYKTVIDRWIIGICLEIKSSTVLYPYRVEWLNMKKDTKLERSMSYDYDDYCRKVKGYITMRKELEL